MKIKGGTWSGALCFMLLIILSVCCIGPCAVTDQKIEQTRNAQQKEKQKSQISQKPIPKSADPKSTYEVILQRELEGFFMDIPEVVWCKFDGNTVYVGFEPYPHDGRAILRGAALHGNDAINFGCHVWAVHADQKNNPPWYGTLSGKFYDEVTARYGKFE